jgi:hypothetical protein
MRLAEAEMNRWQCGVAELPAADPRPSRKISGKTDPRIDAAKKTRPTDGFGLARNGHLKH